MSCFGFRDTCRNPASQCAVPPLDRSPSSIECRPVKDPEVPAWHQTRATVCASGWLAKHGAHSWRQAKLHNPGAKQRQ